MCFSARISFFAAGLLLSIALATYAKVRHASQLLLASMPLIFALQQSAEGALWLLLTSSTHPDLAAVCTYIFLIIALIVWPIYVPTSVLLLEKQLTRKSLITLCLVIGLGWSIASAWYLIHQGATAQIQGCHIAYQITTEQSFYTQIILYSVTTIVPFLVSSSFALRLLGALIGLSCALSVLAWYQYFISVWCFFAALLSFTTYKIIADQRF